LSNVVYLPGENSFQFWFLATELAWLTILFPRTSPITDNV